MYMLEENKIYSNGTRVVIAENRGMLSAIEPINVSNNNIGTIISCNNESDYVYSILLDNDDLKEVKIPKYKSYSDTTELKTVEEVLSANESILESCLKRIDIAKNSIEFISKTTLNTKSKKQENYDIEIEKRREKENKDFIKASKLRKEILECKDKSTAISLLGGKKYSKYVLQEIGFSLSIYLDMGDIKSKMIKEFVDEIWKRNKEKK